MKKTVSFAVLLLALVGCQSDSRGTGDAPAHQLSKHPVDVYPMPDGFPNVATLCDGHGHRMYVVTHNKTDVPVTVVTDASCGGLEK